MFRVRVQLRLRASQNLKQKKLYLQELYVIENSIQLSGLDIMTLKIRGQMPLRWAMHRSQFNSLNSNLLSCLGSQEPEGGVVLGLHHNLDVSVQLLQRFYTVRNIYVILQCRKIVHLSIIYVGIIIIDVFIFILYFAMPWDMVCVYQWMLCSCMIRSWYLQ